LILRYVVALLPIAFHILPTLRLPGPVTLLLVRSLVPYTRCCYVVVRCSIVRCALLLLRCCWLGLHFAYTVPHTLRTHIPFVQFFTGWYGYPTHLHGYHTHILHGVAIVISIPYGFALYGCCLWRHLLLAHFIYGWLRPLLIHFVDVCGSGSRLHHYGCAFRGSRTVGWFTLLAHRRLLAFGSTLPHLYPLGLDYCICAFPLQFTLVSIYYLHFPLLSHTVGLHTYTRILLARSRTLRAAHAGFVALPRLTHFLVLDCRSAFWLVGSFTAFWFVAPTRLRLFGSVATVALTPHYHTGWCR